MTDDLTSSALCETMELQDDELEVVLRLLQSKLPGVLEALNAGGNGWKQIMTLSAYLLAATLNRHPEYAEGVGRLLVTLPAYYAGADALFAAEQPLLWKTLVEQDVATVLIPDSSTTVAKPN